MEEVGGLNMKGQQRIMKRLIFLTQFLPFFLPVFGKVPEIQDHFLLALSIAELAVAYYPCGSEFPKR